MTNIFVYGTLKTGYGLNKHTIGSSDLCRKICDGKILGFEMYSNGSYPYILPVEDVTKEIQGEVWKVNSDEMMDTLRGIEGEYQETKVQVTTPEGNMECIAYVYMGEPRQYWSKIESGIFTRN